jgi:hypothetical protein
VFSPEPRPLTCTFSPSCSPEPRSTAERGPELVAGERRQLKAAAAARYVKDLVDTWPPLTDAQRGRLAALLLGGTRNGDGDAEAP